MADSLDMILRRYGRRRRLARGRDAAVVAAGIAAAVWAIILAIWAAAFRLPPEAWLAAGAGIVVPAALAWSAGWAWPIRSLQTARLLDRRFALADRLATAWELQRAERTNVLGQLVIAQARRVASELPDRARFHRLGRKMLAADGLAILLCAAILLLASPAGTGPPVVAASDDEEEIPLSAELQRELAAALRQAARAGQAATAAESYEQLADAVEADDAQAVAEILRRLREEGVALRRVLPSRPARTLEAVGRHASQSADDDHAFEPAETASETTDAATVGVYSPDGADASADPAATADRPGRDFSDAWRAARQRAQRSVRGGRTPAEYRPILRRYFDLESSNP